MLDVRLGAPLGRARRPPGTLALPVGAAPEAEDGVGSLLPVAGAVAAEVGAEAAAYLRDVANGGGAGVLHALPRPLRQPALVLLVGVGTGDEAHWRAAGAAVARAARREASVTVALPAGAGAEAVRGLAEGAALAAYRYRLGADPVDKRPKLRTLTLALEATEAHRAAVQTARAVVEATVLARDLTNTPSNTKTPAWFARRIERAARQDGLTVRVREPAQLAAEGFNGILAVGGGSASPPRLVELFWRPAHARTHVVLVGKGITFDTGGICLKTREGMKLMRKDMGGAAAVVAATIGAAALGLPVRITALAPLAENMPGGAAARPGDIIRHFGGVTTEVRNTDAEGRLVLADALAYAAEELRPDLLVDLATLTGAQGVALGKRTAALYSDNDALAEALMRAANAAGESVWRLPLIDDYRDALCGDVADLVNSTDVGAGSVMAALFLREFTGTARSNWAHVDMSAPAWADSADAELAKGATGWGVRTLLRWLAELAAPAGTASGGSSAGQARPATARSGTAAEA